VDALQHAIEQAQDEQGIPAEALGPGPADGVPGSPLP
jgi:hypothetical protein